MLQPILGVRLHLIHRRISQPNTYVSAGAEGYSLGRGDCCVIAVSYVNLIPSLLYRCPAHKHWRSSIVRNIGLFKFEDQKN